MIDIYNEFNTRLNKFGKVVIAGGAVRDHLLGKKPKDYDIFVLYSSAWDFDKAKEEISPILSDLIQVEPSVEWHRSEPYLVATVKWNDLEIQVMVSPMQTKEELVGSFDWNICLFAYDGEFFCGEKIEEIESGKELKLNTVTFPLSTMRRGFRFSERFKMKLP